MTSNNKSRLFKYSSGIVSIAFFLLISLSLNAQDTISVKDFGLHPNTRENAVPIVKKAIEACRNSDSPILSFPRGRYDFWPAECEKRIFLPGFATLIEPHAPIGIFVDSLDNLQIEGNGSEFIFHGNMMSIGVQNSTNTTITNITIDWDRPFISQGNIELVMDEYVDIVIDPHEYPYIIEDQTLFFTGEGWRGRAGHHCLFDKDKKEIVYLTRDNPMGAMDGFTAEELEPGRIRLYGKMAYKPEKGTYIAFYNKRQYYLGIGLYRNQNTTLENVTIHHSPGSGVLSFFCDGLTFRHLNVAVNEKKGRVFSTLADATYFPNCKGLVKIENCHHTGQTDDWANFRGTYTIITKIPDNESVLVKYKWYTAEKYYLPGDEVSIVDTDVMQRKETKIVKSVNRLDSGETEIVFTTPLPGGIKPGYALENMTWTPEVEVRNCTIPKRNRARGILISTPKRAVIENNYFRTAGTAILIEGDIDHWYEAGAINNLVIQNNVFDNCLTSGSSGGTKWEWGEAIITVTPSHRPENERDEPYHRNIVIKNNTFKTFDIPLVRARSVRGLQFNNNTIIRTYDYKPYAWQKSSFLLDGCRDVVISGNSFSDDYITRSVKIEHMQKSDLKIEKKQKIEFVQW